MAAADLFPWAQGPGANSPGPAPVHGADEKSILRRYAETHDPDLKSELSARFLPLARALALRYRHASEPLDDLMQVASLGLVKALDGFDPSRGERFVSYAAPTILGELRRHFRDRVGNVRLPRPLQERATSVSGAAQELAEVLGRTPTPAAIAAHLGISEHDVLEAIQADEARHTISLDGPASNAEPGLPPLVEAVGGPDAGYERVESQLAAAGAPLDERERTVLRLRFDEHLTQREIGHRIDVSQMQVSRIMRRALRKLLDAVKGGEQSPTRDSGSRTEPDAEVP
jgi:RNA polymerase sigma-B factor